MKFLEILNGIDKKDKDYRRKMTEYDSLKPLAATIKDQGILNPIIIYKHLDIYRLVAGERRFLASYIADKNNIQAKILEEKPTELNLRLLQWVENNEREDLTLNDRMNNIRAIINEYINKYKEIPTVTQLSEIMSISYPQASNYLAVINAPKDIQHYLREGKFSNLEKVAFLAKIETQTIRELVTDCCLQNATLKEMKFVFETEMNKIKRISTNFIAKKNTIGRPKSKVTLGYTRNTDVIEKIFNCIFNYPTYKRYRNEFNQVNFKDPKQATTAFRKLIEFLEAEGISE
ncbi:MAG: Nucleoid occlusion protein [Legionellaceae bacterium]